MMRNAAKSVFEAKQSSSSPPAFLFSCISTFSARCLILLSFLAVAVNTVQVLHERLASYAGEECRDAYSSGLCVNSLEVGDSPDPCACSCSICLHGIHPLG